MQQHNAHHTSNSAVFALSRLKGNATAEQIQIFVTWRVEIKESWENYTGAAAVIVRQNGLHAARKQQTSKSINPSLSRANFHKSARYTCSSQSRYGSNGKKQSIWKE